MTVGLWAGCTIDNEIFREKNSLDAVAWARHSAPIAAGGGRAKKRLVPGLGNGLVLGNRPRMVCPMTRGEQMRKTLSVAVVLGLIGAAMGFYAVSSGAEESGRTIRL